MSTVSDIDTIVDRFADYLLLERALSENTRMAYLHDVALLREYFDSIEVSVADATLPDLHE